MNHETAIGLAQYALKNFLRYDEKACGIRHAYRNGRWDIYSFRIGPWFIQLSDNGGRVVYTADISGSPSYF